MKIFHFWSKVSWTDWQIKSVLRLHVPIWTVMSINMIAFLCSGCMDLYNQCYDLHFALRSHGPILHMWTHSTEGLWIFHFVLRSHWPIWLPFCAQVTWTYMIGILHSGCMDLLYLILQCCPLPSLLTIHPHNTHVPFYKLWHYKYKYKIVIWKKNVIWFNICLYL